jgi:hybrid cluster-associated redox disulfide protein
MDARTIDPKSSVETVLREQPGAAMVFLRARTACPGCAMSRFCTLEDAASYYSLDLGQLIDQLRDCARETQPPTAGRPVRRSPRSLTWK